MVERGRALSWQLGSCLLLEGASWWSASPLGFPLQSRVSFCPAVQGVRPVWICGASLWFGISSWPGLLLGWQWLLTSRPEPQVQDLKTTWPSSLFVPTDEFCSLAEMGGYLIFPPSLFTFYNGEFSTYTEVVEGILSNIITLKNVTEIHQITETAHVWSVQSKWGSCAHFHAQQYLYPPHFLISPESISPFALVPSNPWCAFWHSMLLYIF